MRNLDKYKGVIPAFYACYDKDGNISPEAVQALTKDVYKRQVYGSQTARDKLGSQKGKSPDLQLRCV